MSCRVIAAVSSAERRFTIQEFDCPPIGDDDALLRVELCGLCGSDGEFFNPADPDIDTSIKMEFPVIPGHEPVGILEEIGATAARRWGVELGDRVVIEGYVPCGRCRDCLNGHYAHCLPFRRGELGPALGFGSVNEPPGLWGGYSQYIYVRPNTLVHRISRDIPAELAVMYNPLAAALQWVIDDGGVTVGSTVAVLGSGQRGLMSVVAAKQAGAKTIIVSDLGSAANKLALAAEFGADHVVAVDTQDLLETVAAATGGALADVVLDLTGTPSTVEDALTAVRPGGRVVLAGLKGRPVPHLRTDLIVNKGLQVRGGYGTHSRNVDKAIQIIESRQFPIEKMHTHSFALSEAEHALRVLRGEVEGENPIHVAIRPDL